MHRVYRPQAWSTMCIHTLKFGTMQLHCSYMSFTISVFSFPQLYPLDLTWKWFSLPSYCLSQVWSVFCQWLTNQAFGKLVQTYSSPKFFVFSCKFKSLVTADECRHRSCPNTFMTNEKILWHTEYIHNTVTISSYWENRGICEVN